MIRGSVGTYQPVGVAVRVTDGVADGEASGVAVEAGEVAVRSGVAVAVEEVEVAVCVAGIGVLCCAIGVLALVVGVLGSLVGVGVTDMRPERVESEVGALQETSNAPPPLSKRLMISRRV